MKKLIFLPVFLFSINFSQIQNLIEDSITYQISKQQLLIYQNKLKAIKSLQNGQIDISYQAIHFFTRPYTQAYQAVAVVNNQLIYKKLNINASDTNHYIAQIKYSYPIFDKTLSSSINYTKLQTIKANLAIKNTKRNLILQSAKIYSQIYTLSEQIKALKIAKNALLISYKKAKALYKAGLINQANLELINGKYYETLSKINLYTAQKNELLNNLSYLLNKKITNIGNLEFLFKPINILQRADIKEIRQSLNISKANIQNAKASLYPKIALNIAIKREADDANLKTNNYENLDKSYIAIGIDYNFNGQKKYNIQNAKIAHQIDILFYKNYLNQVKTKINNDKLILQSLYYQLKAINKEILAKQAYYDNIKSKFNKGLVDSEKLNQALVKLTNAKIKKESIKAQIFLIKVELSI